MLVKQMTSIRRNMNIVSYLRISVRLAIDFCILFFFFKK